MDSFYPAIFPAIISVWLLTITLLFVRLYLHYQSLTKNASKKDLISCLNNLVSEVKVSQKDIANLEEALKSQDQKSKSYFQRVGFIRFNPFTDTGGDQSFAVCLMDENSDGIVISSLHSRESTRVYAKKIIGGKSPNQVLSKEETEVIRSAINSKTNTKT